MSMPIEQLQELELAQRARARKLGDLLDKDSIHYAALTGDIDSMERLVMAAVARGQGPGVTLNEREPYMGSMPLHLACNADQLAAVQYLLTRRAVDIDAGDFFLVTPLHVASIEDHYEVARCLIQAGACVSKPDSRGDLPIHWAATVGHSDIIELLTSPEGKSPVDARNKTGWTPLHRAAFNGRTAAVALLLKLGAATDATNDDGNTPLHLACFANHLSVAEELLHAGAPTDILNERGQSCEALCISEGCQALVAQHSWRVRKRSGPLATADQGVAGEDEQEEEDAEAFEEGGAGLTAAQLRRLQMEAEGDGFPQELPSPACPPSPAPVAQRRHSSVAPSEFLSICLPQLHNSPQALLQGPTPASTPCALSASLLARTLDRMSVSIAASASSSAAAAAAGGMPSPLASGGGASRQLLSSPQSQPLHSLQGESLLNPASPSGFQRCLSSPMGGGSLASSVAQKPGAAVTVGELKAARRFAGASEAGRQRRATEVISSAGHGGVGPGPRSEGWVSGLHGNARDGTSASASGASAPGPAAPSSSPGARLLSLGSSMGGAAASSSRLLRLHAPSETIATPNSTYSSRHGSSNGAPATLRAEHSASDFGLFARVKRVPRTSAPGQLFEEQAGGGGGRAGRKYSNSQSFMSRFEPQSSLGREHREAGGGGLHITVPQDCDGATSGSTGAGVGSPTDDQRGSAHHHRSSASQGSLPGVGRALPRYQSPLVKGPGSPTAGAAKAAGVFGSVASGGASVGTSCVGQGAKGRAASGSGAKAGMVGTGNGGVAGRGASVSAAAGGPVQRGPMGGGGAGALQGRPMAYLVYNMMAEQYMAQQAAGRPAPY